MENLNAINELTVGYAKCIAIKTDLVKKKNLLVYVKNSNEEELIKLNGYYRDCINLLEEIIKSTAYIMKNINTIIDENLAGLVFGVKSKTEFLNEKLNDPYFIALSNKYIELLDTNTIDL